MITSEEQPYIKYIIYGLIGDFIQQLSIINENYLKTGRKGILYIANSSTEPFKFGLEKAYLDTEKIVKDQPYIAEYHIHNGETVDIDLNSWRNSPYLYTTNWYHIYKNVYNVEWGAHRWLHINQTNPDLVNKICVSHSMIRPNTHIDYPLFFKQFPANKIVFLSQNPTEYENFCKISHTSLPLYQVNSLYDLIIAINSCYLYIGNLTSTTAIAHALHKNTIVISCDGPDHIHIHNLNTYLPCILHIIKN